MIATEFKLIPIATLSRHEPFVLRGLGNLPVRTERGFLDKPEVRYPFLYYALLTHWPDRLGKAWSPEELLYNRLYWFLRFFRQYQAEHDLDARWQQQAAHLAETAAQELGASTVAEIEQRVTTELTSSEKEIVVSFSEFSLEMVLKQFGIRLDETGDYFTDTAAIEISPALREILRDQIPLGLAIGTEKARSEYIVAPLLAEVRRRLANAISVFSGIELDVDAGQGLRGVCDFLLCQSPSQLVLTAPIVAVVEAKKEDMGAGMGQCLAELIAARLFNQRAQKNVPVLYGVVTTGSVWKFLRLTQSVAYVDVSEYHINDVDRIVGIIMSMFSLGESAQ